VAEEIVKRKIELNEIIVAEIEGETGDHLRLEYLWSNIPYIGLIFMREQQ
jgi:hypothetical protein